MQLDPIVRAEVEKRFPTTDARVVVSELERLRDDGVGTGPEGAWEAYYHARILMAVVKYTNGEFGKLEMGLALARGDFRDLLKATGLEGDDWPEVLAREGFRVPPRPLGPEPVAKPSRRPWPWGLWWSRARMLFLAIIVFAVLVRLALWVMRASFEA